MKQGEEIMASIGTGCAKIRECSANPQKPYPDLTIMIPAGVEVINEGHSDAIVAHHPAKSLSLGVGSTKQLYDFLKSYFDRADQAEEGKAK